MKLVVKWGEREKYEVGDFSINPADVVKLRVDLDNKLTEAATEAKVDSKDDLAPFNVELVGGTQACRWYFEQLNPLGRHVLPDFQQLDDLVRYLSDVYVKGITEAVVLVNYYRSLERRSKTYDDLRAYREEAQHDEKKVLLDAVEEVSLREALVQAKIKRYENVYPPRDPNQMADLEKVVSITQFADKYVVADRVLLG